MFAVDKKCDVIEGYRVLMIKKVIGKINDKHDKHDKQKNRLETILTPRFNRVDW